MSEPLLTFDWNGATISLFKKPKSTRQSESQCVNKFYTAQPIKKRVTKEEFNAFLKQYPRKLVSDVYGVCDPPAISYNDFELANRWPYSIVANTWAYEDDPNDYYYAAPENREYYIVENFAELFDSKTGYQEE